MNMNIIAEKRPFTLTRIISWTQNSSITSVGRDLSKLVRRYHAEGSRFPSNDINTIITGVVSALKHIQQLDIIHSDIKPDNVLYNTYV